MTGSEPATAPSGADRTHFFSASISRAAKRVGARGYPRTRPTRGYAPDAD